MRYIQIFISSTFSDMHRERDLLRQIAGLVNRDILDLGYQIVLRDLRYGIDTTSLEDEREIERKILSECFEVIKQCELFVLLTGDRYGTVFDDLTIPKIYLPVQKLEGKSVTHLEVEYGKHQIGKERILVFERDFEGDLEQVPIQYREQGIGIVQNKRLKEELLKDGYQISKYSAWMNKGNYAIDEYRFIKHGQGYIEQLVLEYIESLKKNQNAEQEKTIEETIFTEVLNEELKEDVERKLTVYPKELHSAAKQLLMLRIQELLSKKDYEEIYKIGTDGKAILTYRKQLVREMPNSFLDMLKEICRHISHNVGEETHLFEILQVIACVQRMNFFADNAISLYDLQMIRSNQCFRENGDYASWCEERAETSGIYREQLPIQRALAYFFGNQSILQYTNQGYSFQSQAVADLLGECYEKEIEEQAANYVSSVFWYMKDPAKVWIALLKAAKYEQCFTCLKWTQLDMRLVEEVFSYGETETCEETLVDLLEGFLIWLVEQRKEACYIGYVLAVCDGLVDSEDDDIANERYQRKFVPLCQRIHDLLCAERNNDFNLTDLYLLRQLYLTFEVELEEAPEPFLSMEHMDKLAQLNDAVYDLFWYHDLDGEEGLEEYTEAMDTFCKYQNYWDELVEIIRLELVRSGVSREVLLINLLHMLYEKVRLDAKQKQVILEKIMGVKVNSEELLEEIGIIWQYYVEPAFQKGEYELCVSHIRVVYDVVNAEIRMRRCDWLKWIDYITGDVLYHLCNAIRDDAVKQVREMLTWYEESFGADLTELDEMLLAKVEQQRKRN